MLEYPCTCCGTNCPQSKIPEKYKTLPTTSQQKQEGDGKEGLEVTDDDLFGDIDTTDEQE